MVFLSFFCIVRRVVFVVCYYITISQRVKKKGMVIAIIHIRVVVKMAFTACMTLW